MLLASRYWQTGIKDDCAGFMFPVCFFDTTMASKAWRQKFEMQIVSRSGVVKGSDVNEVVHKLKSCVANSFPWEEKSSLLLVKNVTFLPFWHARSSGEHSWSNLFPSFCWHSCMFVTLIYSRCIAWFCNSAIHASQIWCSVVSAFVQWHSTF